MWEGVSTAVLQKFARREATERRSFAPCPWLLLISDKGESAPVSLSAHFFSFIRRNTTGYARARSDSTVKRMETLELVKRMRQRSQPVLKLDLDSVAAEQAAC